jgi:hypothetical protein
MQYPPANAMFNGWQNIGSRLTSRVTSQRKSPTKTDLWKVSKAFGLDCLRWIGLANDWWWTLPLQGMLDGGESSVCHG